MDVATFFSETIGTSKDTYGTAGMPGGRMANVQCSADIAISFWNPAANAFGLSEPLLAPGGPVYCPHDRAKLTSAAGSSVTVTLLTP